MTIQHSIPELKKKYKFAITLTLRPEFHDLPKLEIINRVKRHLTLLSLTGLVFSLICEHTQKGVPHFHGVVLSENHRFLKDIRPVFDGDVYFGHSVIKKLSSPFGWYLYVTKASRRSLSSRLKNQGYEEILTDAAKFFEEGEAHHYSMLQKNPNQVVMCLAGL